MPTSILITGCSSGIGLAAARALKARGYLVFAGVRKEADLERRQAEGLQAILLDVNDSQSIERALEQVLSQTGGTLDALFNNAGYLQAGAIEDLSREMLRQQFETNVFGAMELVYRVLPIMRKQGHGRIIQNSSILGVITLPYYGAYNASKFALEGFSRTLQQELRGTGIQVAIINPGPITSELRRNALGHYQQTVGQNPTSAYRETYQKLEATYFTPSRRDRQVASHPDAVVKKLILALESKRPKLHYFIGVSAQVLAWLQRLLPERLLASLLARLR